MENTNQIKPTAKETIAKFNLDMTRKTPIAITFYHIGTQKVTSGEYLGCSMVASMEFIQVIWLDTKMNNCKMATSVQLHNILLME